MDKTITLVSNQESLDMALALYFEKQARSELKLPLIFSTSREKINIVIHSTCENLQKVNLLLHGKMRNLGGCTFHHQQKLFLQTKEEMKTFSFI